MADKKISELTELTTPDGTEELVVNDSGVSKKVQIDNLLAGGTISNFTSTGIDDNATSTAITIDASENVGIGTSSPDTLLHLNTSTTGAITPLLRLEGQFTSNSGNEGTAIDFVTGSDGTSIGARIITVRAAGGARGELRFCSGRESDSGFDNGRMVIDESGNVEVNTGNLVIGTSGKGIDFSAVSDGSRSVSSNILDDYEEGVHICVVTSDTGTITLAGDNDLGYVKIGNIVHVSGRLNVSSVSSPTGIIRWSLPFTSWAGAGRSGDSVGTVQLYRMDITSAPATMSFYLPEGTSNGYVTSTIDDGFWDTSDISPDAGDIIVFSITYRTA